jgi:hypothetical protein
LSMKRTWGLILCCIGVFLIQCSDMKSLPPAIAGKWETADPAYQGEYIDITTGTLTFGKTQESFTYRIVKVKEEKAHQRNTFYSVFCKDEAGQDNLFTFIYSNEDGGTLRQKSNTDLIWKRAK